MLSCCFSPHCICHLPHVCYDLLLADSYTYYCLFIYFYLLFLISFFFSPYFQCCHDKSAVTDELVQIILQPGLDPGAVDVFLDFICYSGGPLPEELLPQVKVRKHATIDPKSLITILSSSH